LKKWIILAIGLALVTLTSGCQKPRVLELPPQPQVVEPEKEQPQRPPLVEKELPPEPQKPEYSKQLPPGELSLRKITDPEEIPDFTEACEDLSNLEQAIGNSLNYLRKPSSEQFFPYGEIRRKHAEDSLKAFAKLIGSRKSITIGWFSSTNCSTSCASTEGLKAL